ncbi:unnamed protein product [Nippostrongylus brasiliensis]|uniref:C2H2-type domain-containing protein n=1 Tax=Nippostrongylus brasiliensis TaxID=27835 RepID=A0A0N4XTZ0_NIPBR|nr:unnamed protein product [Nippostrongylus brasiliensis]
MRKSKTAVPRRTARTSKASTSSESENLPSDAGNQTARAIVSQLLEDVKDVPLLTTDSMTTQAMNDRPSRSTVPKVHLDPKALIRSPRQSQRKQVFPSAPDGDEYLTATPSDAGLTARFVAVVPMLTNPPPPHHLSEREEIRVKIEPHQMEVSYEVGDDGVADDDMENDLVDIQPFETSDTANEAFLTASFNKKTVNKEVSVSVITITQLLERAERSVGTSGSAPTVEAVPCLDNEIVVTSSSPVEQIPTEHVDADPTTQEQMAADEAQSKFMQEQDDNSASMKSFNNSCEDYTPSNERDFPSEDVASQMEPPVLDGPIIDSSTSYDMKPNIDVPPKLMANGGAPKENPKPMHYVVGEIYRVHTPNGSEALVNANGDIVDLTPEDSYATIDICDIDFNFLDDKSVVCGLCGEVVLYSTLFSGHLTRVHPEMMDPEMVIGNQPYVEYLKRKLESDRKNIQSGFKISKQSLLRRSPRKVSQIRINPSEMTLPQLEIALRKKLLEKMGRRVRVTLVDKEHVKCGLCNAVISINKKFEIVHVVRHFNAWHPTSHQCAGQWQKRTQRPGVGKPLSKQDFAVIDLSHTQPDNLQCIWCGMFIDATTIAVHFTDCHPGEVEVPKCLLCIQELVINARIIEKFGSDFGITLRDEFHIKVEKLNKLFTSESQMDAVKKYLDALNGKRKRAPLTVERRVFDGDSMVVHTTAIPGEDDSADDLNEEDNPRPRKLTTNSRQVFGRHNKPKRSMVQPTYRQAAPVNSEYVKVINESHWKCKICDADLYGAVISACAIRHFKLKHPQESDSLQFEVVRARLDRISDGCMEFVHPQMLECLICHLTYQLHKPYNVCRGIRHLKSRHPEIMPEFNGEPLRRYRKTGTALRLDDDPNIPRRRREQHLSVADSAEILARMKAKYPNSFDKVHAVYGGQGEPMFVVMNGAGGNDKVAKDNLKLLSDTVAAAASNNRGVQDENNDSDGPDIKPGREVVFELSYDYNNLDADGKPQKHLVRVTPGSSQPSNVLQPATDKEQNYFVENDVEGQASLEEGETGPMYFAEGDRSDSAGPADESNVAEDGSLFVLDDIVSAGLHPCGENVEEVYDVDEEIMGDASSQEMVLQEEFESQGNDVPDHRYQAVGDQEYSGEVDMMEETVFDEESGVIVQSPYEDGVVVVEEGYADATEVDGTRHHDFGEEVIIDNEYVENGLVLQEEGYQEGLEHMEHSTIDEENLRGNSSVIDQSTMADTAEVPSEMSR